MEIQMWMIWAFLTPLFIVGELIKKKSFFLWLGFSSAFSCILALLNVPSTGQLAVFLNVSGILILLEHRFNERYRFKTREELSGKNVTPFINRSDHNVFRKSGPVWEIVFNGRSYTVKHSVGLSHIRNLITNPGQWITCTDLKTISSRVLGSGTDRYGKMSKAQLELENLTPGGHIPPEDIMDKISLDKIKNMRDLLRESIDVDDFHDPEALVQKKGTLQCIDEYLKKNTNIHGKSRKIPDRAEADRKAVSAAINRSRKSLKEHRDLYTHFKSFIQAKGNSFRYLPDRQIYWKTD